MDCRVKPGNDDDGAAQSPNIAGPCTSIVCLARRREPQSTRPGNTSNRGIQMALIHDREVWEKRLATLPLARYEAGETVFAEGTKTGRLLILKSGALSIFKGDIEFAQVAEPGAVFGELSALLDEPHSADVRALETSEFHLADATTLLQDPVALLYVTMVLARRIDTANKGLLQLKIMLAAGEPKGLIDKTLDGIEGLLSAIGAGYIRAGAGASGYPFT
jgi:CRP/FNR family transcriptional regulator, cyclic AMP receptor protein